MLDFDEILVNVKNPQVRKYLEESIKSYRVGNYRSAILAVWIAAMFDIVKKFEILVDQREPNAIEKWRNLKPKIENHKNWERELIEAAEAIAMISRYEASTLKTLSETRNRYAHPSFDDVGALFDPTPEEVRYFIRTLYDIVLSQSAQLGAFYVNQLIESIKDPNFFTDNLSADELTIAKDSVTEKINRINQKQLPRLIKELFQSLNSPNSKEHELNILCFIINLYSVEAELNNQIKTSTYWDSYVLERKLNITSLEAILNYPECLNQLSEKSQKLIEEFIRSRFSSRGRYSKSFAKLLTYADVVPIAKSLLDDAVSLIPMDKIIELSKFYSDLFGDRFAEIFGEAILDETRRVLKTLDGYKVNPALSALRKCGIWKLGDSLDSINQKGFANELILSLNYNNWETMSLLSFKNRTDIPIKWIKLLLEQWEEHIIANSWRQYKLLFPYLEHYLGLVERYKTELGEYPSIENTLQTTMFNIVEEEITKAKSLKIPKFHGKAAIDELLVILEEMDEDLSSDAELDTFWKTFLLDHKPLINSMLQAALKNDN